jgi:pyroglutamyl-peptidase
LRADGLAAEISNSAGTFVCNHVFYGLMHLAAGGGNFRGGFLHVPPLQRPATQAGGAAPMALDDIVRGIRIVLQTAAAR